MNKNVIGMHCIRCGASLETADYLGGCPVCAGEGIGSTVTFDYADSTPSARKPGRGMMRYGKNLPYETFPTLGEGDTPLIAMDRLAAAYGMKAVYTKNEFQNPTGSHKDRMNPLIAARALELKKDTIAVVSSGNEGMSMAAYAAAAGIRCVVITTKGMNPIWEAAIRATGAEIVFTDTPEGRYRYLQQKVSEEGWYSATSTAIPPVGSCCYGIQGYKTISYELYEDLGKEMADYIFVPLSRGDLLWGMFEGFQELERAGLLAKLPRLVAVDPYPRIDKVMDEGRSWQESFEGETEYRVSLGGNTVTYQTYLALKESDGLAVSAPEEDAVDEVREMAAGGYYLEASSAINIGGLKKLRNQGRIGEGATAVFISTSSGVKNNRKCTERIIKE